MRKVSPSTIEKEGLHRYLTDLEDVGSGSEALSELVRRAATLAVQEALEAEQRDFIGRDRYERGPGRGYRSRLYDFPKGNSDVVERLAVPGNRWIGCADFARACRTATTPPGAQPTRGGTRNGGGSSARRLAVTAFSAR